MVTKREQRLLDVIYGLKQELRTYSANNHDQHKFSYMATKEQKEKLETASFVARTCLDIVVKHSRDITKEFADTEEEWEE